jgi:hypothetical protein
MDGRMVGKLQSGKNFIADLSDGNHTIQVKMGMAKSQIFNITNEVTRIEVVRNLQVRRILFLLFVLGSLNSVLIISKVFSDTSFYYYLLGFSFFIGIFFFLYYFLYGIKNDLKIKLID